MYRSHKAAVRSQDGVQEDITWIDIELPVVFSGVARRRSIDLIGHSPKAGSFLCELKFNREPGPATLPDYAILQAILYYRSVAISHTDLDKENVYRKPAAFRWKDVKESKRELGNSNPIRYGLRIDKAC